MFQRCFTYILLLSFISCEHITEPLKLDSKALVLRAPLQNSNLTDNSVIFSWEDDEAIEGFRLQVATPNFSSAQQIFIDTLLDSNSYKDSLVYNKDYEWRLRGENSLYSTPYFSANFSINSQNNISEEIIQLYTPNGNILLNSLPILFSWESIESAESYRLQIAEPSFEYVNQIVRDTLVMEPIFYENNLPENKIYQWRVRAENRQFRTDYSTESFQFSIAKDISGDNLELLAPAVSELLQEGKTTFSWQEIAGAKKYHFQLVTPDFDNISQILRDTILTTLHHNEVLPVEKKLQWRIRAENDFFVSEYSVRDLTILSALDISSEKVNLVAPRNFAFLQESTFNFTWSSVEGASEYQIQVARPKFSSPLEIVVDTIIKKVNLRLTLKDKIQYQWRVRGINKHNKTPYSPVYNFEIKTQ